MDKTLKETQLQLSEATKQVEILKTTIADQDTYVQDKINEILLGIFTQNQIDVAIKRKTRAHWTVDEISKAFTIRYFSKRCYLYLRNTLKYPLPGISTLQLWASNLCLTNGVLNDVLRIMETSGTSKNELQRITVLSFDEMKVRSVYEYDNKEDEVVGPYAYLQVIMARGLFDAWKQPVYIGFDKKITKEILMTTVSSLHHIKYHVVAIVSDCGASNQGLWKALEITPDEPYILHPEINKKIYVFADAPHLLKLMRNWFLDTGFELPDGSLLSKHLIKELIQSANKEISSLHKLTKLHLEAKRQERQNVALAAQLMSHTTATALKHYFQNEQEQKKRAAHILGSFIDLVNRWFDLMNSYTQKAALSSKKPYGLNLDFQNETIQEAIDTFGSMKCIGKDSLQVFQRALLMSLNSLKGLFSDMKNDYDITYLITHRLNQDCLENFFSQIRTRGGLHDHPSPLNVIHRIRMIILGKNPGVVQGHTNIQHSEAETEEEEEFLLTTALQRAKVTASKIEPSEPTDEDDLLSEIQSTSSSSSLSSSQSNIKIQTEKDGLLYLAGYLAYKYKDKFTNLGDYTYKTETLHSYSLPGWLQHLSFGGLSNPSAEWLQSIKRMEKYFSKINETEIKAGSGVIKRISNFIHQKLPLIPLELVKAFSRQRLFIRIKYLNFLRQQELANKQQKRKAPDSDDTTRKRLKKMTKIVK